MARRVSTLVDLMAGSDESLSPLRLSRRLESAVFDPRRTAGLDLLGTDPSTPETMKLPVAVGPGGGTPYVMGDTYVPRF